MKKIKGTKEWSTVSVNCVSGCSHDCRYCYARWNAVGRFKRLSEDQWTNPEIRQDEVKRGRKRVEGRIMFPSTHDITPAVLEPCLTVLHKCLQAGNQVLIVSKPHLHCIREICSRLAEYREQILFRFTIGAMDNELLAYWEPGAPAFNERMRCLKHAFERGFATSVSIEPMLDPANVVRLYRRLEPYVTDTIWIGKMNCIKSRVEVRHEDDRRQVERITAGQTDQRIQAIYQVLKDCPKVRWKESIKQVVGLELASEAGLDQ